MKMISIDTSSLSKVVKTDTSAESFFNILESSDIVLNVPSDCLMELASGDWIHDLTKQQGVSYRLERFVNRAKKFNDEGKLLLNEIPQKVILNEVEHPNIKHTSVGSVKGTNIALFDKKRHKQIHADVTDVSDIRNKAKLAAKEKDKRAKASKVISSMEVEQSLRSFQITQANPCWRDFLHSQFTK